MANRLTQILEYGQSIWYDNIRRGLITSGELQRMIEEDGLRGVTANPAIFEKAIGESTDYDRELETNPRLKEMDPKAVYEYLAIQDIQSAADLFKPVYGKTKGRDGYVSFEVSPLLADDTAGTIEEARRLWKAIGRENVMIKVPATAAGLPAIQTLIGDGININITLLFAQEVYEKVAEAFIAGLESLASRGGKLERMASVASFFVSRIDTLVDAQATARLKTAKTDRERSLVQSVIGKVAVANAKLAYQRYKRIFAGPRWESLAKKGAQTQRLLWASTGTKNPSYRDVFYVEELIGQDTVDTIAPATLDAFRDHGRARACLEEGIPEAQQTMKNLEEAGISMKEVTDKLTLDGVRLFSEALDKLLAAIDKRRRPGCPTATNSMSYGLPADNVSALSASLEDWQTNQKVRRLWSRDASLWRGSDEAQWLGWLGVTEDALAHREPLLRLVDEVKQAGFSHVLLLGMGGSSLCPEVLKLTFGRSSGCPELLVLDSTDPAQIRSFEKKIDLKKTLFVVSSKSGTTLEPNIFKQYFFKRVQDVVGAEEAGKRFIAITDPGSKLQEVAQADRFRHIFFGVPSIGGRYSALSNFGLVPAAVMGLDVKQLLDRAEQMVHCCSSVIPPKDNPGALLGNILGVLGKNGRDKVTLFASPGIRDIGAWLEQLLAESTGKDGKGLIPVDREEIAPPERYGKDRLFVYLRLDSAADSKQDAAVDALQKAGQPVVRIRLMDPYDLAQEFFRWEFATAVAGSILGINAFNQPDVEASKQETRKLTAEYERTGSLPKETPFYETKDVQLFADEKNVKALQAAAGKSPSLEDYLRAHLSRLGAGDYFALLAYVEMNDVHEQELSAIRHQVRDRKRNATCLGFGPRFLHSTGQAYKGGPNTGVFLQVTCKDENDLAIPGQKYTFGVVKAAQARGDFQVLAARGRRALRVHLMGSVPAGLASLKAAVTKALS